MGNAEGHTAGRPSSWEEGILTKSFKPLVCEMGKMVGHGSCLALLDKNKRKEAERIATKIEYRELAATTRFQELFVSSMFFTSSRDFEDEF